MTDAAAPLPAAAISRPHAWADANDLTRIPAGVIGFAGRPRSRAAACDSLSPARVAPGRRHARSQCCASACPRAPDRSPNQSALTSQPVANGPVLTGPAHATFAARNDVALWHARRAVRGRTPLLSFCPLQRLPVRDALSGAASLRTIPLRRFFAGTRPARPRTSACRSRPCGFSPCGCCAVRARCADTCRLRWQQRAAWTRRLNCLSQSEPVYGRLCGR